MGLGSIRLSVGEEAANSGEPMQQNESSLKRLGPIRLAPGVEPAQVGVFMVVMTITSCLIGFVTVVQPYLLTEVLHVPVSQQGRITGLLNTAQYGAVALFVLVSGALADIVGRKPMLIMAIVGLTVMLVTLPFAASVAALFALRCLMGLSSTGHIAGTTTMIVDYPSNETRGKFISMMFIFQAVVQTVLVGWVLPHTPAFLIAHGVDRVTALRCSLWILAAIGVVGLVIAVLFLREPPRQTGTGVRHLNFKGLISTTRAVLAHSRVDPTFGLILVTSFVIRSDFFVTQSFMSVWVMGASKLQGIAAPQALKTVGMCSLMWTSASAVSPLFLGFIADRVNRVGMLLGAMIAAALAFSSTLLVHDVQGPLILIIFFGIGVAEMAQTVSSSAALGERAPPGLRGSAIGFFVLTGTISVVVISYLAGILFDKLGFIAPFLFLAILNLVFVAIAVAFLLAMRKRERGETA